EIFAGQAQLVAVRGVVDDAGERGVRAAVLRIGLGAQRAGAADVALVAEFLPVAARIGGHQRPVAAAPREDRSLAILLVGAAVAGTEEAADSLARLDEIGGIGGDKADRAREPV